MVYDFNGATMMSSLWNKNELYGNRDWGELIRFKKEDTNVLAYYLRPNYLLDKKFD